MATTISLTQTLDDREVVEKMQKQINKMEQQIAKMRDVARAHKDAGKQAKESASEMEEGYDFVGKAIDGVNAGLRLILDTNKALLKQADEIEKKYDSIRRKWQNMTGQSPVQSAQSLQQIQGAASDFGVRTEVAAQVAEGLYEEGMSAEDASGKGLQASLRASRALAQDPVKVREAMSDYFDAVNREGNANDIEDLGQKLFKYRSSGLGIDQLGEVASAANDMDNLVDEDSMFAAMAAIDRKDAGSRLGKFVRSLSTAKGNKTQEGALRQLGLEAGDVDFVGEDLMDITGKLNEGLGKLKPEEQAPLLADLFGGKNSGAARDFLSRRDTFADLLAKRGNPDDYLAAATVMSEGREADLNRAKNRNDAIKGTFSQGDDARSVNLESDLLESGTSPAGTWIGGQAYDTSRALGASPETAGGFGYWAGRLLDPAGAVPTAGSMTPRSGQSSDNKLMEEQTSILRRIEQKLPGPGAPTSPVMKQNRE